VTPDGQLLRESVLKLASRADGNLEFCRDMRAACGNWNWRAFLPDEQLEPTDLCLAVNQRICGGAARSLRWLAETAERAEEIDWRARKEPKGAGRKRCRPATRSGLGSSNISPCSFSDSHSVARRHRSVPSNLSLTLLHF